MTSSTNRFAALAEDSSSSKEPGSQKPVTGTKDKEDQTMQDTGSAGPSYAMGELESSLPKVMSIQEGAALFLKRKQKALAEEEQRAKKSRQGSGSTFTTPRTIPSAAPDSDDEMDDAKEFDFRDIVNPNRRFRCMFRYEDASGQSTKSLGSLSSQTRKGVVLTLAIDAGRYGAPQISLAVGINEGDEPIPKAQLNGEYSERTVTWRAGVVIEGQKIIETLNILAVKDYAHDERIHDKRVVDSCPKQHLDKLVAITMKCNSARVTRLEPSFLEGLDAELKEGLEALFTGVGTHTVTFWFKAFPDTPTALKEWGSHLENAVMSDLPSFRQYLGADGLPVYEIDDIEPISTFQRGMYVEYRSKRDQNGKVQKTKDGRRVEDKNRPVGYHNFEKQLSWEAPHEFGIFNIISQVRDIQFAKGQVAYLEGQHQYAYLQNFGKMNVRGAKGGYVPKELAGVFRCFIRQRIHGPVPPPGATITLQWDNSNPSRGQPHVHSKDPRDTWRGTVLANMEASCKATGTDFCAMVTMPERAQAPRSHPPGDQNLPDDQLQKVHVEILIDQTAVKREIDGMKKFADLTHDTENLAPVRMAIMSAPSGMTHTTTDLTAEKPAVWKAWKKYLGKKYRDNQAQFNVVTSIEHVENKMTACIGPPGTGKTTVLADTTIGAVMCGHKTLVCAVSNNAVDKAANSVWDNFPKEQRNKFKFLRYETTSAEMQAYLTREDITEDDAKDQDARPKYKKPSTIEDDDLITQTMAEASQLQHESDNLLMGLYKMHGNFQRAYEELRKINARKRSNVAAAMTLPNRVFLLTQKDQYDAFADFQSEMTAYRREKMDAAELDRIRQTGGYRTEAELIALGQDKLDETEIAARERDGRIPSRKSRDKSFEYRDCLRDYVENNGKVKKDAKLKFKRLRKEVVIRVMQETHCVFASCNNAGSDIMKLGFRPRFINIDETGQLTISALANVLTSFTGWLAVILFGDPKQTLPFFISGRANEFRLNAQTSVLALLEEKGYPVLRLVLQYRMAPAISQFVSRFFYDGLMKNHPSVLTDNDLRAKARQISKSHYGITGPNGDGSEYWMIDVANGVSRVQLNGTSLQNYANADRLATLVDQTLFQGVKPAQITVLVYYTGQLALVSHKIEMTAQRNGRQWTFGSGKQVSSVDSFQGEENEFVFIDVVTAHQKLQEKGRADDSDSEEDEGAEGFKSSGRVTAHVKSPNRLCCALTRGKSCVVVVCQLTALLSTVKPSQRKASAALGALAKDFLDRKLVCHNYTDLDTSPIGEETRAKWDKARQDEELRQRRLDSINLLNVQRGRLANARITKDTPDDAGKVYRIQARRTTRPNIFGATVDEAEAHDIQSKGTIATEAGAVPLTTGTQTQHAAKEGKKAARAQKEEARRATKDAGSGRKGTVQQMPADPKAKVAEKEESVDKGKGKEKELPEDVEMLKERPGDPEGTSEEPEDTQME